MPRLAVTVALALLFAGSCVGSRIAAISPVIKPAASVDELVASYKDFLDQGRTPSHVVAHVLESGGWKLVDPTQPPTALKAGDRVAFVNRGRSIMLVLVGRQPLERAGFRMIVAHIDTPAPRLILSGLSRGSQKSLKTRRYGGLKTFQWQHRPLAIVGSVATPSGEVRVELGLQDDFAFWGELASDGNLVLTTGTTPSGKDDGFAHFVDEMHKRYGVTAADLESAELYAVPVDRARDVGFDRAFVGAHGQDDRANSFVAWRAVTDSRGVPQITAIGWLVDREEVGSTGPAGAQSQFLELVVSYLLRAGNERVTEALLHRTFAASSVLSSDTPACVNPNWPEAHERMNAPVAGRGPAIFPYTGRRGKVGGSAASAGLIAKLRATFDRVRMPIQTGTLGHVDRGGGGTVAKYLAHRGPEVVDLGVCVISMHSPLELVSKVDLWSTYWGLMGWLDRPARKEEKN